MKYTLSTMFIVVTLIAVFCAYPAWFARVAFAILVFGIYFAACARVGENKKPPQQPAP